MVALSGETPPEGSTSRRPGPWPSILNRETVLLPALTSTSRLPSSASAPWPPAGTPVRPVRAGAAGGGRPFPATIEDGDCVPGGRAGERVDVGHGAAGGGGERDGGDG